jgi:hypothetical protein
LVSDLNGFGARHMANRREGGLLRPRSVQAGGRFAGGSEVRRRPGKVGQTRSLAPTPSRFLPIAGRNPLDGITSSVRGPRPESWRLGPGFHLRDGCATKTRATRHSRRQSDSAPAEAAAEMRMVDEPSTPFVCNSAFMSSQPGPGADLGDIPDDNHIGSGARRGGTPCHRDAGRGAVLLVAILTRTSSGVVADLDVQRDVFRRRFFIGQ